MHDVNTLVVLIEVLILWSITKIKFYLYKKSNDIFNKISNFIFIKTKFYLYQKSKFIFIKNQILSLLKFYLIFAINYLDIFLTN